MPSEGDAYASKASWAAGGGLNLLRPRSAPEAGLATARAASLAQVEAQAGIRLRQPLDRVYEGRAQHLDQTAAGLLACAPGREERPQAVALGVAVVLAGAGLRRRPREVVRHGGEEHHAEREAVSRERVVAARVHLGGLVVPLAPTLALPAVPQGGRCPEVDDLDHVVLSLLRQQDVLEGQVPVRDAQLVKPPHREEDLDDDGLRTNLVVAPGTAREVDPREQVALRGERRDDVRRQAVAVDAVQVAGEGEADPVQVLHDPEIVPGLFLGPRVLIVELDRAVAHPRGGHALHRHPHTAELERLHQLDDALVRLRVLQLLHQHVLARVPALHAAGRLPSPLKQGTCWTTW
mmetsp:Transcript_20019/g.52489  ORF Transcript_20019/g.52489 Transcript_20019/m.52489 type:complete len:349 (-) Transcript_20019:67-1113(-)